MDYVPTKRAEKILWLQGIVDNVIPEAVKMGVQPTDATLAKTLAEEILAKCADTDNAVAAAAGKQEIEKTTTAANVAQLRGLVRNWKTLPGYPTSGSESVLGLKGGAAAFDPHTYKPVIQPVIEGGMIRFNFTKLGVDALAIYCRLRGTTQWTRIGIDTESPYFDTKPVAVAGTPEVREYMARGMLGDSEIGVDSDIVAVTLPG